MTGLSSGPRSASYGSLPSYMHNGSSLVNQLSPPFSNRKLQKMSLLGSREKDRGLPWIFKIVNRRKVGILILVLVSVAVLSFLSLIFKAEDTSTNSESLLGLTVQNFVNSSRPQLNNFAPPFVPKVERNFEGSTDSNQLSPATDNITDSYVMALPPSITFTHHPCESFTLPPPPADKKRTGPRPCPVCYVPVEQALALMPRLPSVSPVLKDLNYIQEENLIANETNGGSIFGGHPSLQQRAESFDIKESMTVHCGFVKGRRPGQGTGFDIDENDLLDMEKCHGAVVASAIFGNYDVIQQPKNISDYARKNACFYMFVDEETEAYIKNSSTLDDTKRVGLWRVVTVRNLPYTDARRNGKVPKLLVHRLFPNARFSLWIDGKLELVVDPYQIFERFLWRSNSTFAISRHYRRFDVFDEAEANKAAGKYDNASIDQQIEFYKNEGLTHYSSEKLPITSDVPEGCVIIKEHTPISNLFTCLWFNEVDRFTSRDQISFSTVRDKIMSRVNWTVNMFLDCERRNFVVQGYHRDVLEQKNAFSALSNLAPPVVANTVHAPVVIRAPAEIRSPAVIAKVPPIKMPGKVSMRRGKDRRRHRGKSGSGKD